MNINDATIYVFTRNDLPLGQDDIQSNHACFHLGMVVAARLGNAPGIPFMVVKEKLKAKSLNKLIRHCADSGMTGVTTERVQLSHYAMQDDDIDKENPTALAVIALDESEKEFFRKYPLRKYGPAAEQSASLPASGAANADLAQLREHPVSNGEVVGENPAVSSKHLGCS